MLCCPRCQSVDLKPARRASPILFVLELAGYYRIRCQTCENVFGAYWGPLYKAHLAKCPCCFKTELTTWNERVYSPGLWDRLKLGFGARRVRCERCRKNFTSFRAVIRRKMRTVTPVTPAKEQVEREPLGV